MTTEATLFPYMPINEGLQKHLHLGVMLSDPVQGMIIFLCLEVFVRVKLN